MKNRNIAAVIAAMLMLTAFVITGCRQDASSDIIRQRVWLDSGVGTWIRAEITAPDNYENEKLPLITIGHGFRGDMDSAGGDYLAEALAESGFAVIRMDYAAYDERDEAAVINQYTVDTMIESQLVCIRYMIEEYNVDSDRIGLYGRSLGGRVAMAMANKSAGGYDYKALALVAPAGTEDALSYYMGGEERWQEMKREAGQQGSVIHQNVILTPEFFSSVDDYTPAEDGGSFKNPVLVIYNTEDYVVLPETSRKCAAVYENAELVEVTSEKSPHGYEMGFKSSKLKDELISRITDFFEAALQ